MQTSHLHFQKCLFQCNSDSNDPAVPETITEKVFFIVLDENL